MKRELASVVIFESHAKAGTVCKSSFVHFIQECILVHRLKLVSFFQESFYYYVSYFDFGCNEVSYNFGALGM